MVQNEGDDIGVALVLNIVYLNFRQKLHLLPKTKTDMEH